MIKNSNKLSSRGSETELLELIANLIASYSHHNELYNSLQVEIENKQEAGEEADDLIEESKWHYNKMEYLLEERRNAMRLLKEMGTETDGKMRCLLKHSVACYQFAQEILNTDMENIAYIGLAEATYQYMYECVSKFLGVELVTCGRCLKDALED